MSQLFKYQNNATVTVKRMHVFAIVPVKRLNVSKTRLSEVLSLEKRNELTVAMLRDVLDTLKSSKVHSVLVVSPDYAVKQIAGEYGFSFILSRHAGLNPSLKEAIEWCTQKNAASVLVLPADLPLVSPEDISRLIELGSEPSTVVLSPSLDCGTNALLLRPPDVIPVRYGKDSFIKHIEEALKADVQLRFYASREVMLDIDSEDDLNKLLETKDVESKQVFKQLKPLKKTIS